MPDAAAAGRTVVVPDVEPESATLPRTDPACPSVRVPVDIVAFAVVAGAMPAPPPITIWFAASCADVDTADDDEK